MDNLDLLIKQQEYVYELAPHLDKFRMKRSNPLQAEFRCDICGDSETNKSKKRGSIFQRDHNLFFNCYNCGYSNHFVGYLKEYHNDLYRSYLLDVKFNKKSDILAKTTPKNKIEKVSEPVMGLTPVTKIPQALEYVKKRKIPQDKWDKIYYVEKFMEYINSVIPGKFPEEVLKYDEPRLVIPFFDNMDNCFGVQGRSFKTDSQLRYITIIFDEGKKKVFGFDQIDSNQTIYCTEGPIDSFFLPNCIAMAGSDISDLDKNVVIVLDNEPRNKALTSKYDKYITNGHKIVIWPKDLKDKDINDMIIAGSTPDEILRLIESRTFQGLKAKMYFNLWRKI